MTAAFQLCVEETEKLLMMLLIFLLSGTRILASTSKRMMLTPPICNTKLSSWSVYKATGKDALSCGPEDMQRKTSCCVELSSDSSARVGKGSFLDLYAAAAAYKAAPSSRGWKHTDVLSASPLFSWCEYLCLPDINGDSAIYPSRGTELIHSVPLKEGAGWLVQPNLNWT